MLDQWFAPLSRAWGVKKASRKLAAAAVGFLACGLVGASAAPSCGNNASGFSSWLSDFRHQAEAQGIRSWTLRDALDGVRYSAQVIRLDRSQHSFHLSFEQFYARRVNNSMIEQGRRYLRQYGRTLDRIERRYGVPGAVLVSIWGLETGYGRNNGRMPVFSSLATLAYDCRRSDFFTNELMNALEIVQRRDMSPSEMRGAWAGELGQTQFMPSSYMAYAVDFDGDGRRDLIRSVPDVLASTANYLKAKGWLAGQSWGPGTANHQALEQWNRADVYVRTISVMAEEMAR